MYNNQDENCSQAKLKDLTVEFITDDFIDIGDK
jgi:hypothetical protein